MKIKITKNYNGNIEFIYGEESIILTDKNPSVILTEKEYESIPEYKQYLLDNMFVIAEFIEEKIKIVEIKENKKFNK